MGVGDHPIDGESSCRDHVELVGLNLTGMDCGVDDLTELHNLAGDGVTATDQVLYNLTRRGPEYDLLPWCRIHELPVMAYAPIGQGRMLGHPALGEVADRHGASPAQVGGHGASGSDATG